MRKHMSQLRGHFIALCASLLMGVFIYLVTPALDTFVAPPVVHAQQTNRNIELSTLLGAGAGASYRNTINQCSMIRATYYTVGFSAISIELDGAPDNGGAPGTWAAIAWRAGAGIDYIWQLNPSTWLREALP